MTISTWIVLPGLVLEIAGAFLMAGSFLNVTDGPSRPVVLLSALNRGETATWTTTFLPADA